MAPAYRQARRSGRGARTNQRNRVPEPQSPEGPEIRVGWGRPPPENRDGGPEVRVVPEANGAADVPWIEVEGPAPQHPADIFLETIIGRRPVIVTPLGQAPFPDVAAHVQRAVGAGALRISSDRGGVSHPHVTVAELFVG
jgi:hypothetical protein